MVNQREFSNQDISAVEQAIDGQMNGRQSNRPKRRPPHLPMIRSLELQSEQSLLV